MGSGSSKNLLEEESTSLSGSPSSPSVSGSPPVHTLGGSSSGGGSARKSKKSRESRVVGGSMTLGRIDNKLGLPENSDLAMPPEDQFLPAFLQLLVIMTSFRIPRRIGLDHN